MFISDFEKDNLKSVLGRLTSRVKVRGGLAQGKCDGSKVTADTRLAVTADLLLDASLEIGRVDLSKGWWPEVSIAEGYIADAIVQLLDIGAVEGWDIPGTMIKLLEGGTLLAAQADAR